MKLESPSTAGSKLCLILGRVISTTPILMMGVGGATATHVRVKEVEWFIPVATPVVKTR